MIVTLLDSSQAMLPISASEAEKNAAFSLLLPGKVLHLNALSHLRKFRDRGNKPGAVRGFEVLQEKGLGKIVSIKPQRGTTMVRYMYTYCESYHSIAPPIFHERCYTSVCVYNTFPAHMSHRVSGNGISRDDTDCILYI